MALTFPSEEWFEELENQLNDNETYAEQAAGYGVEFDGDYVFTIEAGDGLAETVHYYVGLEDGDCTGVRQVDSPDEVQTGFELSGGYASWKEIVRGEMGAVEGIMSGDLELDGDMNTLLKYQAAATTFVDTCSKIDTEFV